jgi:peptide/nickel transport system ATP-binding protein
MTATAEVSSRLRTAAAADPIVELRDVFCVHRTNEGDAAALQGATLRIVPGEVVCVLGPSGAGKSTLLRVIAGLQLPSAGVVRVCGRDIGRLASRRRAQLRREQIGFLSQHADEALSPVLRVRDAVAMPLALRGASARETQARSSELLEGAGLEGREEALPSELSGGERQRVALCAALAHRPALLLADEPTAELDHATAGRTRTLIAELARAQRATVIIASHDPASAALADRALRLRDGRVVEELSDGARVGPEGWLALAPELLREAGIAGRAQIELSSESVIVRPSRAAEDREPVARCSARRPDWEPARVELRSVSRSWGRGANRRLVLAGLSTHFATGRMTAVTGPSGSGKTTLLRLLAGLDTPDAGEVMIDSLALGADPEARASTRRGRTGFLPQEPTPIGFLSALENVVLALRIRGMSNDAAAARAALVLESVGLTERGRQRVARLSAGEAQRVALARALAAARGLLLVDEPTSCLDRTNAERVAQLLAAAAREDRQTVICATHDPELITHADAVIEV